MLRFVQYTSETITWRLSPVVETIPGSVFVGGLGKWAVTVRDLILLISVDWPILVLGELRVACPLLASVGVLCLGYLRYFVVMDIVLDYRATGRLGQARAHKMLLDTSATVGSSDPGVQRQVVPVMISQQRAPRRP